MEQSKIVDTTVTYQLTPLPMRGSMVMTMVMISPSRRDVSLAEQLRRSTADHGRQEQAA